MKSIFLCCVLVLLSTPALAQIDSTQMDAETGELVFIHSLGSSANVWEEMVPYFQGTYDVWTYELPGHGTTKPMPGLTIETAAGDLERYLQTNDIDYPILIGHGMGGLIAMRYAFDHPAEVRLLVVLDATPKQLATDEQKVHVTEQLLADYDRFVAAHYLHMSPSPEITDALIDQALRTDSSSFVSLLLSSFDFDLTEELPRQAVPILVVGSGLFFPDAESVEIRLAEIGFSQARTISFKRMANTGHYMMLEQPVYLASVILAFIISQSRR
ncbi:MAG: alpha/beta hydrolase [bacterium]